MLTTTQLQGWPIIRITDNPNGYQTLYLRIPPELQPPVPDGRCDCAWCKANGRDRTATWDTLAVEIRPNAQTWTCHAPEWPTR